MYEPRNNWTWELKSDEKLLANFNVGKDEYLWTARIIPNQFGESTTWEVLYQKKDRKIRTAFGFSGSESSVQVISNVVSITMTFLREYGDKVLEFRVSSEGDSRDKLYTRMARRLVPDWTTTKHKMGSEIYFYVVNPRAQELRK